MSNTQEYRIAIDMKSSDGSLVPVEQLDVDAIKTNVVTIDKSLTTGDIILKTAPNNGERSITFTMGGSDAAHIKVGGDSDKGYLEIATKDNKAEPIYLKQYDTSGESRVATLLDANGETSFPVSVTANGKKLATEEEVSKKQDKLNNSQIAAVNSGINSTKVNQYDKYENNKMNNGIIQCYRGQEVSFKTEGNQDHVYFNYRSEQSTPIRKFIFGGGEQDGSKSDIECKHINCWNIDAGNKLLFNGNEANISLKNTQAECNLITFKGHTANPQGHGVLIGGGGSVVIGAGESAKAVFDATIVNDPGNENLRLSADENIHFYPGQQEGFSDKGTYINGIGEYIMNNKKVATEDQISTIDGKISKSDLTFSLSGTTLTISKKY